MPADLSGLPDHVHAAGPPHEFYAQHADQTGRVSLDFETGKRTKPGVSGESWPLVFRVYVDPVAEEFRELRDAFVEGLRDGIWRLAGAHAVAARAVERAERAEIGRRAAEARVSALLGDRRAGALFGAAEVRPEAGGRWSGAVWLLDPAKRFNGFGFKFDRLADLWRLHPYLRPTSAGEDEIGPWMLVERHEHAPG